MLLGAPRTLVWDADFVRGCLRAADACGTESLATVQNALHSTVFTGDAGPEGRPYPKDAEQRDTATQLAAHAVRGSVEEQFYRALAQSAEIWIDRNMSESTSRQTAEPGNGPQADRPGQTSSGSWGSRTRKYRLLIMAMPLVERADTITARPTHGPVVTAFRGRSRCPSTPSR